MLMQNLVLAVQNTVEAKDLGSATSTVSFFRSLGGAAGVSVLGAVLSNHVAELITKGLTALGVNTSGMSGAGLSNLHELPAPIQTMVRASYGDATARIFMISAIISVIAFVAILFIREVKLRDESGLQQLASTAAEESGVAEALAGQVLTTEALEDETLAAAAGGKPRDGDGLSDPLVTQRS